MTLEEFVRAAHQSIILDRSMRKMETELSEGKASAYLIPNQEYATLKGEVLRIDVKL